MMVVQHSRQVMNAQTIVFVASSDKQWTTGCNYCR